MVDIEANNLAFLIEIDVEAERDFPRFDARNVLQLDVKAVRLRVVMQLHRSFSQSPLSRKQTE